MNLPCALRIGAEGKAEAIFVAQESRRDVVHRLVAARGPSALWAGKFGKDAASLRREGCRWSRWPTQEQRCEENEGHDALPRDGPP